MSGAGPFHPEREFLQLDDGGDATVVPVTDDFWQRLAAGKLPQLEQGRLVSQYGFSQDWPSWERHPAGDEVVMLVSGAAEFLLEMPQGIQSVRLQEAGSYVLVPRGIWHTAKARQPTLMLFITPGAGTEHRPA
jgi:hypothetical protein